MSTINVHDIQGLSTYANNVRLPNGHQLRIDGTIKMPEWTVSTRPASPETGQIGWNGELARFDGLIRMAQGSLIKAGPLLNSMKSNITIKNLEKDFIEK